MAIVLNDLHIIEHLVRAGFEEVDLIEGQKVQVRYGTLANPTEMLLETVPSGKKWSLTVSIYIEETNA